MAKKGKDISDQYMKLMAGEAASRRGGKRGGGSRRPYMASDCKDLNDAEMFRMQIMHEIKAKVNEIQNASLGEFKIRELNDEINKLVSERGHWQRQIKELGGPDHFLSTSRDTEGSRPRGGGGYTYYGAAKNLPGVRELFEVETQGPAKRSRTELYRSITPDYYGFRDEDDGLLLPLEQRAEEKYRKRAVQEFKKKQAEGVEFKCDLEEDGDEAASMAVPSQAEVDRRLLEKKKRQLLARYGIQEVLVCGVAVCFSSVFFKKKNADSNNASPVRVPSTKKLAKNKSHRLSTRTKSAEQRTGVKGRQLSRGPPDNPAPPPSRPQAQYQNGRTTTHGTTKAVLGTAERAGGGRGGLYVCKNYLAALGTTGWGRIGGCWKVPGREGVFALA